MRVLHMDSGREMRGGQYQALLLLEGLREAGVDCGLLAQPDSPLARRAQAAGIVVRPASLSWLYQTATRFDLLHVHDAKAHTLAAIASRSRPIVVSRRVAFAIGSSPLSRWKYRRAALFLAVSETAAKQLRVGGVAPEKIQVVYDAVEDLDWVAECSPAFPVVALASRDPRKGRDLVRQAAADSNMAVRYSEDLTRDLRQASMFVYISRSEGFGSAALLAMAAGVPVIASDIDGLREAVGDAGVLVPNEISSIADAMRRIREDSVLRQTLIDRGQRRVKENFTKTKMVEATIAAYRGMIGR